MTSSTDRLRFLFAVVSYFFHEVSKYLVSHLLVGILELRGSLGKLLSLKLRVADPFRKRLDESLSRSSDRQDIRNSPCFLNNSLVLEIACVLSELGHPLCNVTGKWEPTGADQHQASNRTRASKRSIGTSFEVSTRLGRERHYSSSQVSLGGDPYCPVGFLPSLLERSVGFFLCLPNAKKYRRPGHKAGNEHHRSEFNDGQIEGKPSAEAGPNNPAEVIHPRTISAKEQDHEHERTRHPVP